MASHSLVIAKASLSVVLMRPDPASLPRDQIAQFHELLDAVLAQCSPTNIQRCKAWLLRNTVSSTNRLTSVGKYLVALSASFSSKGTQDQAGPSNAQKSGAPRKQLHILYMLNDLLHHTNYHGKETSAVTSALQPFILSLVRAASAYEIGHYVKQHRRLDDLLGEWERRGYYDELYIRQLQELTSSGNQESNDAVVPSTVINGTGDTSRKVQEDIAYVMPASHGELAAPYYDLPAANMMPHIVPNSANPIDQRQIKPLQFAAGPADESLVVAVKDFLKSVEMLYDPGLEDDGGVTIDIDELGQPLLRDELMGEVMEGDSYYGWSKAFCKRMKQRRNGTARSRDRSRSDSLERSRSPRKRRRYTSSEESRSLSRTRSDIKFRRRDPVMQQRNGSYSRSRSHSRTSSRSPRPRYNRPSSPRPRSRSQSYSPPVEMSSDQQNTPNKPSQPQLFHQATQGYHQAAPVLTPPSFMGQFPHAIPLGPGGLPIPPPPPPNYTGPWPPPPPPIGLNGVVFQMPAFVPPPPPQLPAYGSGPPVVLTYYPNDGNGSGNSSDRRDQYPEIGGYGGGRGAGGEEYRGHPPHAQRGGQYGGRGKGARGDWRG